nr:PHD finger protein ALFIN-LIKE 7-like isoform X2 [Ipomoea batatas]
MAFCYCAFAFLSGDSLHSIELSIQSKYLFTPLEKENLCLYGLPNETWEVNLPVEEVPPELPEPALGINFARDGMQDKDWLSLVAVHSDSWLLSVAFYFGARFGFGKSERKRLFQMINELPTVFEVVTGAAKQARDADNNSNRKRATLCGACGDNYANDEFWICCDVCERWFHGKCVKITPAKAEHIKQYKCPSCSNKRARV